MSKVISFSISDRYLDKIRSLYPDLTDNLAAKQFLTDRLDSNLDDKLDDDLKTLIESSLSSSLDDSLDGILDDKLKSLIETSLDGLLDERLDDAVGKFLSQVTERMARLESRLDDSLDDGLDDMEPLLKLQREASIPNPPIEETVETADNVETDSLFKLALKLDHLDDQALIDVIESQLQDDDNEENYSRIETALEAIETVTVDSVEPDLTIEGEDAIETIEENYSTVESGTGEGIENRQGLTNQQLHEKTHVSIRTIQDWANKIQKGKKTTSTKYPDFFTHWTLNPNDNLWYPIN
ncbi:hypothetical protein [Microcystis aeruginosa]|uniref:hypothetical protein n=1 Tax=Microcystis aeruginosa TaxID=1126 RepID=UPI00187E5572|nr:hypothetical protein [Microcystis aeruginosa]MBE8996190.1 hypothetical protein [Microcystis aeruginosa LEGE 91341]